MKKEMTVEVESLFINEVIATWFVDVWIFNCWNRWTYIPLPFEEAASLAKGEEAEGGVWRIRNWRTGDVIPAAIL